MNRGLVTETREVVDRGLAALPVSQHQKLWGVVSEWVVTLPCVSTAKMLMARYFHLHPEAKECFVDYLVEREDYNGAVEYMK